MSAIQRKETVQWSLLCALPGFPRGEGDSTNNGGSVLYEKGRPSLDDAYQVMRHTELLLDVQSARRELASQREELESRTRAMRAYLSALQALSQQVLETRSEEQIRLHVGCGEAAAARMKVMESRLALLTAEENKLGGVEEKLVSLIMALDPVAASVVASPTLESAQSGRN